MSGPDTARIEEALAAAGASFASAAERAGERLAGRRPTPPRAVSLLAGPRAAPGCEAAAALLRPVSPVPVEASDAFDLAAHVGDGHLVVACGLGPFEGARAARLAAGAAARGARAVLVGDGGQLSFHGEAPLAGPDRSGSRQAHHAALAPLVDVLPALLALAGWAGIHPGAEAACEAAAGALAPLSATLGTPEGALHGRLARHIGRTIPLFEGAGGIGAVAASSWRRAWHLLAKAPALATAQPRAAFEDVAGFGQHGDVTRQLLTLVSLRTPADAPEDVARSRLFADLAGEALAGTLEIAAPDGEPAAALVHLLWLGLATASARASQEGLDPGPLPASEEVEDRLAAEPSIAPPP